MPNRLAREASPYLQQHAENPVDWFPWSEEALISSKHQDKPILLSVGYSACHWCHVMAHECFEDAKIAALMNEHFVCIKVDREERPDIDQIYQLTVQLLGRSGGWPLTVFLTPEQKPFFAGTYFPPSDRHGLPSFSRILLAVADAYKNKRDEIDLQSHELSEAIVQASKPDAKPGEVTKDLLAKAAARLSSRFDDEHGGFGSRPKFPSTMSLDLLLAHGTFNRDERARARVRKALDAMRDGGIYDQLGGGFHRYSTDESWLVPHFEKMLYDNALLLRLYVDGFRAFGDERYASSAREIVAYLKREMLGASGGFYATQDADSDGDEGKFFVWTRDEVRAACGDDAELACARFGVLDVPTVLHVAKSIEDLALVLTLAPSDVTRRLENARAAMLAHREKRIKPFRDEKILASWNGLLISALADASCALAEPKWLALAENAFAFLMKNLAVDDRVLRHVKNGVAKGPGFLDDQAYVACAAVDLYEATGSGEYLRRAHAFAETIRNHFTNEDGELCFVADDSEPLIARTQDVYDHAMPSATSKTLELFARLGAMRSPEFATIAVRGITALAQAAIENPFGLSTLALLADRMARTSVDIVLVGRSEELHRATYAAYVPHRVVVHTSLEGQSDAMLLSDGKRAEKPSVFVCHAHSCAAPVSGYRELMALLGSSA